ncbi:MAG: NAD(P)/FAD-dependent oxidoreductase [Cyclobacteriaceae bacterium]|jgi:hypothetical protein|nr:NAD(P)/FAD-dependent oxidoreductase [Cyclobacteriaceae bacterium]
MYDLIVIGGGAAGFFGAIRAAELRAGLRILILEKTTKLLAKVKISGGGRCNVTHHCLQPTPLSKHYPRGQKTLKRLFQNFHAADTIRWFAEKGVPLKAEEDNRMFPVTDDSQTIIDCFLTEAERHRIEIKTQHEVTALGREASGWKVTAAGTEFRAHRVLIATGGHPQRHAYDWLRRLGHSVIDPLPSLFTFNEPERHYADLMGVAVARARVKIAATAFEQAGAVLITHWGLSGPAVIKLSAWAAVALARLHYTFTVLVNWIDQTEEETRSLLLQQKQTHGKRGIYNNPLFQLPARLWQRLVSEAEIAPALTWAECPQKAINKLTEKLVRCPFSIRGKTTYKEEFVTCGGVDVAEVDSYTLQSRQLPGVYFAGEVLNIDGETGGFNFQAAWTTADQAARAISLAAAP